MCPVKLPPITVNIFDLQQVNRIPSNSIHTVRVSDRHRATQSGEFGNSRRSLTSGGFSTFYCNAGLPSDKPCCLRPALSADIFPLLTLAQLRGLPAPRLLFRWPLQPTFSSSLISLTGTRQHQLRLVLVRNL